MQQVKMKKKDYEDLLEPMELELNNVARWLQHTGKRVVVLFEGRDTAGKGGVINAIADGLNPRQVRIAALPKPTERERTQWYFQRYVEHLPSAGEIVLFDRSWYNRAAVSDAPSSAPPSPVIANDGAGLPATVQRLDPAGWSVATAPLVKRASDPVGKSAAQSAPNRRWP